MKQNEIDFILHFEKNLKGKGFVLTQHITESYFILYQKHYMGATCINCLSGVGQELKNHYYRLKPLYDDYLKLIENERIETLSKEKEKKLNKTTSTKKKTK